MSVYPFRTVPLKFPEGVNIDIYRTGNYTYVYDIQEVPDGFEVLRNDGRVMGKYGTFDQAFSDISGFQRQDALLIIQQWKHAQAHGIDLADTPLCLRESPDATS